MVTADAQRAGLARPICLSGRLLPSEEGIFIESSVARLILEDELRCFSVRGPITEELSDGNGALAGFSQISVYWIASPVFSLVSVQ